MSQARIKLPRYVKHIFEVLVVTVWVSVTLAFAAWEGVEVPLWGIFLAVSAGVTIFERCWNRSPLQDRPA